MIKHLVADGRYDYIETGSLISIRENVKNIVIPSEELKINMNPMDFEEFLWALNEHDLANTIKNSYKLKTPLSDKHHKLANFLFRRYLIVGGMPDSVKAFIKSSFQYEKSDFEKKKILNLYNDDIHKIKFNYRTKLLTLYKNLPSVLSRHDKRIIYDQIQKNSRSKNYTEPIFWLSDSKIANICYMVSDPRMPLRLSIKENFFKTYLNDTGLLFTQAFDTKIIRQDKLYSEIIMDNFHINEGMFFENVVAQTLTANGYDLLFYKHYNKEKHYDDMEIDFLIIFPFKDKYKISPIEVKSSKKYKLNSLLLFNKKFKSEIGYSFVVHTKIYKIDGNIIYLPIYMLFCLKED